MQNAWVECIFLVNLKQFSFIKSKIDQGSANGFHLAPFLRQWNALLQVNVEKNRHHGVFVIPASSLYYPPYGGGYGLYSPYNPYNLGEIGGGGGGLLQPNLLRPSLFDDYKQQVSTSTLV